MSLTTKDQKQMLLFDGAMGTYYNQRYQSETEAEEANLSHPDQIIAIHKAYIEAGARVIRTNTFAINHVLFPDQKMAKEALVQACPPCSGRKWQRGSDRRLDRSDQTGSSRYG